MRIYCVGGAVRDSLLGLPVSDHDYVVVGATPQQMLQAGYLQVGKDFPVFLHPHTHDEYALARTERKTAPGYKGFQVYAAPDVTLEEDLARRDLTINAIARDQDGQIIDPWGGQRDLQARILRHVSQAFSEDPVRILRLARFAARFTDFEVAPETMGLMQQMVAHGEVDALVAERVWQEVARGLQEARPSRMLQILRACGAWARLAPELEACWRAPAQYGRTLTRLDHAPPQLALRFALLLHELGQDEAALRTLCARWKTPTECQDLALLYLRHASQLRAGAALNAAQSVALLQACDAWRRPERFDCLLQVLAADWPEQDNSALCAQWQARLHAASAIDSGAVAQRVREQGGDPAQIGHAIHAARVAALAAL
ncbi:multifunctional CCA tRNA nucleotidyl transferase/2'3'-cyclic phosphodiesterase/2'nucleotidase/phosphatase [Massilia sp. W12]|uniref:multifunctional CCA tRNA nucleotidyl transferase/2'3'-cyclic phosphodiesterase/2'nucleotidase/phosphatase n=1 Tax=Massilia sp. W12 TaxID=3126507 RepID=UPI0030CDB192